VHQAAPVLCGSVWLREMFICGKVESLPQQE